MSPQEGAPLRFRHLFLNALRCLILPADAQALRPYFFLILPVLRQIPGRTKLHLAPVFFKNEHILIID